MRAQNERPADSGPMNAITGEAGSRLNKYRVRNIYYRSCTGKYSVHPSLPPGITLRPALAADLAFCKTLYSDTMVPLLTALDTERGEAIQARFLRSYDRRRSTIIGTAATSIGWMQVSRTATGLHLDQLHLSPGWRGRGIGGALVSRLLARAGRAGRPVGLDVIHGNPALALYRRMGFTVVATDHEKHKMLWRPPEERV